MYVAARLRNSEEEKKYLYLNEPNDIVPTRSVNIDNYIQMVNVLLVYIL